MVDHGFVCFTEVPADGNGKGLASKSPKLQNRSGLDSGIAGII